MADLSWMHAAQHPKWVATQQRIGPGVLQTIRFRAHYSGSYLAYNRVLPGFGLKDFLMVDDNKHPKQRPKKNEWLSASRPGSSFTKAELDRMGGLEFHYHELLSHDAVSAALEVADQKHEAQDEPIKMVETDLTYDKTQKMSASEATAAQLRDPKRLAISICARAPPRKQATRADLERTEDVDPTSDRR
jgi:hypothetical protein